MKVKDFIVPKWLSGGEESEGLHSAGMVRRWRRK
jgi:hypothetical protein